MTIAQEMLNNCVCQKARAAARSVTSAYDEMLRPVHLRATQLAVLAAVGVHDSLSITALAYQLGMDRTTLSRNLGPLKRLVSSTWALRAGAEAVPWRSREKRRSRLHEALPLWQKAPVNLRHRLGGRDFENVRDSLDRLTSAG